MKQFNRETGKLGEEEARRFLGKKGYKILESNFSTRFGEIDIIASKNKILVFVEVKAKVGEDFGAPEEMINRRKLQQVHRMAEVYLLKNKELDDFYPLKRIDAVAIVLNSDQSVKRLNHYENIEI